MTRRTRFGTLAAYATIATITCSGADALAEYRHRILVLEHANGTESDHEIATRVRAELGAAGFEVVVLPILEDDPKRAVESAGHDLHPASVLLVERRSESDGNGEESPGAELWLADRMLKKTVVLRLKRGDGAPLASESGSTDSREAARVAVQAVELVKARLAELAVTREHDLAAPPEPPPPAPPPPAVSLEPEPHPARANLTAAVGLLEGFAEGQRSLVPVVRLGVSLTEAWPRTLVGLELRANFLGLGRASRIEHGPGAATVRHTAASVDAVVHLLPRSRVQPFASLGAGLLALDVAGDAPEPYRNEFKRSTSGLLTTSAGIWLQPVRGIGVVLEGQLLGALRKTIVRVATEKAGEVGSPLLLMSAGLKAEF